MGEEMSGADKMRAMTDDLLENAEQLNMLKEIYADGNGEEGAVQAFIMEQWGFTEEEVSNLSEAVGQMYEIEMMASIRYWV